MMRNDRTDHNPLRPEALLLMLETVTRARDFRPGIACSLLAKISRPLDQKSTVPKFRPNSVEYPTPDLRFAPVKMNRQDRQRHEAKEAIVTATATDGLVAEHSTKPVLQGAGL